MVYGFEGSHMGSHVVFRFLVGLFHWLCSSFVWWVVNVLWVVYVGDYLKFTSNIISAWLVMVLPLLMNPTCIFIS